MTPLERLQELADPAYATVSAGFFKTGPGEYGEGDEFLGVRVPQVRVVVREFRDLPLKDVEKLLASELHEVRLFAVLVLVDQYRRMTAQRDAIYDLYLRNTPHINNWDLVDSSAPQIVGAHLASRSREPLKKLARSKSLWERRIAMIATQHFIRNGEVDDALEIAAILIDDRHDLIHKAIGWMLREAGDRDRKAEETFLRQHAATMPRTALRYAIEHFSPAERKKWMGEAALSP